MAVVSNGVLIRLSFKFDHKLFFLLPEATTSPAELTKRFGQTMKHAGNKELILSPTLSSSKKYEFSYIYVNRDGNNSSSIIAQTVCFPLLLKCTLCGCFVEPS